MQYFWGAIPSSIVYTILFSLIGVELEDLNELDKDIDDNKDMKWSRIVEIVFTVSFCTLTMMFTVLTW